MQNTNGLCCTSRMQITKQAVAILSLISGNGCFWSGSENLAEKDIKKAAKLFIII